MALAQPIIDGESMPSSVYNAGDYMFYPQQYEIAGDGSAVAVGTQSALWRYEVMTPAQLSWWINTALGGANSNTCAMSLWINYDRETVESFTSGVVYAPDWRQVQALPGGLYGPVEFRFDHLLPIVNPVDTGA